jgi:predicted secreted protein
MNTKGGISICIGASAIALFLIYCYKKGKKNTFINQIKSNPAKEYSIKKADKVLKKIVNKKNTTKNIGSVRASIWHKKACEEKDKEVNLNYTLIPKSFYEKVSKLPQKKIYDFNFIGCFLYDLSDHLCRKLYKNRKWIIPFINERFNSKSYLQFTDEYSKKNVSPMGVFDYSNKENGYLPRKSKDKLYFDENYYNILCASQFTLCPAGDQMWSMRFYESLMCKSIPIVNKIEETYRTEDESEINYKFYYADDPNIVYREDWVEHNYNLFLQYHTLEYAS